MTIKKQSDIAQEALDFHSEGKKGKIGIALYKPLANQIDLSLAYTPGVAAPCLEIYKDPLAAFKYTAKGNFVAVISNGTAVLGLGNLGALASKPVMEGKAALFKRFADVDSMDLELDTEDPTEFINTVRCLSPTFGGINLEDIKAPDCFIIERELKKLLHIPVFHDDQHGTAIIVAAGIMNALEITNKNIKDVRIVVNGAGAAAIACIQLIKEIGLPHENAILCDTSGVIYKGRTNGMNEWKEANASETKARTLTEALDGADIFLGLSAKGALTGDMILKMAPRPIIFAMANPDPEITPQEAKHFRPDAIVATGRSDYNNQINNVMCFPYIFRGALDVEALMINEEMKIAAAKAIANLAKEKVPEEVASAYQGKEYVYGPEYIIPVPFDPRLIQEVPAAVAEAAMRSGVARKPIIDFAAYKRSLAQRLNPTHTLINSFFAKLELNQKTIIFSEGEEEQIIIAATQWCNNGYGSAILVGNEEVVEQKFILLNIKRSSKISITNYASNKNSESYVSYIYQKLQRKGYTMADCLNLMRRDSDVFASVILAHKEGDALITGITQPYLSVLNSVMQIIDRKEKRVAFALSALIKDGKIIFIADTAVNELPTSEMLADIAISAAEEVESMGYTPRVALISFSTFGKPMREHATRVREAVKIIDQKNVSFEYDGEMSVDVALNKTLLNSYPFCRLSEPANILIMPALHSSSISAKLLQEFGGATLVGPILSGLDRPVQILQNNASILDILGAAAIAARPML